MQEDHSYKEKVYEYMSLAPTDEPSSFDKYNEVLSNVLYDQYNNGVYRNKNIAITGVYGSGKSSFIYTYFCKHNSQFKPIYINFGKYHSKNKEFDEKTSNFTMEQDIENSLLQQIIYNARPEELPFSKISRSDYDVNKNKKAAIITSFMVTYLLIIINLQKITDIGSSYYLSLVNYLVDNCNSNSAFAFSLILFLACVFVSFSIVFFVLKGILVKIKLNSHITKISIKGNELQLDEHTNSPLSKALDELIHFFMVTEYNVVIIEDLDRLDNSIKLLTKLKEINFILNNSIKDKTIRFVYEISDSIFDSCENRTKFFDSIVPVASYVSPIVSKDLLTSKIDDMVSANSIGFNDYNYVGAYVTNPRIAFDICNEFYMYYNLNVEHINSSRIRVLFLLISYKVLFPDRFEKFMEGKGALAYCVSDNYKYYFVNKYVEIEGKKYNDRINSLINYAVDNSELMKDLNDFFIRNYQNKDLSFYSKEGKLLLRSNRLGNYNSSDYKTILNDTYYMKDDNNIVFYEKDMYPGGSKMAFTSQYLNPESKRELEDCEQQLNGLHEIVFEDLKNETINSDYYNGLLFDSSSFNNYRVDEDPNKSNATIGLNELNDFERYLLNNVSLSKYSYIYLSTLERSFDDTEDLLKFNDMVNIEANNFYSEIHNIDSFMKLINYYLIRKDSFCVKTLYERIVKDNNHILLTNIMTNLTHFKLKNILLLSDEVLKNMLSNSFLTCVWNFIRDNEKSCSDIVDDWIVKTIQHSTISKEDSNYFYNLISSKSNIDDLLEKHFDLVKNNLKDYNISFSQKNFNAKNKKILAYLFENNMYNKNASLLTSFLKSAGYKIDDEKIIESYDNLVDETKVESAVISKKLKDYIINNSNDIVDYIVTKGVEQRDNNIIYSKFIKHLDKEHMLLLLDREAEKISNLNDVVNLETLNANENDGDNISANGNVEDISNTINKIECIENSTKYLLTLGNINYFFKFKNQNLLSENVINYINEECVAFEKEEYSDEYLELFKYIFTNHDVRDIINESTFSSLVNCYCDKKGPAIKYYVGNYDDKKIDLLYKSKVIYTDNLNDLISLYSNNDISSDIKKIYLRNSFNSIDFDIELISALDDNIKQMILEDAPCRTRREKEIKNKIIDLFK